MNGFTRTFVLLLTVSACDFAWTRPYFSYEPVGRFDEVGKCYSGAVDEDNAIVAVGCESGIFIGPPEKPVRISMGCSTHNRPVSRIRFVGKGLFAASTSCGLYRFGIRLLPVRIAMAADTGALAVVDESTIVVVAHGELFQVDLESLFADRVGRWPSCCEPISLAWSTRGAISMGYSCQQGQAPWTRFMPPVHGARALLWDEDHVLWIGPWGKLWRQDLSSSVPVAAGNLGFFAAERMRSTKTLGRKTVWIRTDQRWFVLDEHGIIKGWLPEKKGPFVPLRFPVRAKHVSRLPILVGRGVLFKAIESNKPPSSWCAFKASPYFTSPGMGRANELEPELWLEFLPRIVITIGMSSGRWHNDLQHGIDDRSEDDFRAFVVLQWPFGSRLNAAQSQVESLRAASAARRLRKHEIIYQLMTRLQLICQGPQSDEARLESEEVLRELQLLGIHATKNYGLEN